MKNVILKNVFWISFAEVVVRLLKLAVVIYVARVLGANGYGEFSFALSFVSLFNIFFNFGLADISTREFSKNPDSEKDLFSIIPLKMILSFLTLVLIFAGSFFISSDIGTREAIWILGLCLFVNSFSYLAFSFFKARQKMEYEAAAKIFQGLVLAAAVFFLMGRSASVFVLSIGYLLSAFASFLFILFFFCRKIDFAPLRIDVPLWKKFLSMSWPLALAGAFSAIYSQTDSVMLGYAGQTIQTGWYNAAAKIAAVALVPVTLISQGFFPALSAAVGKKEEFGKVSEKFIKIMVYISLPMMAGGVFLASKIIPFIYGSEYGPSVPAFQTLIISSGLVFLYNPLSQALVACGRQKYFFWAVLAGSVVNVSLNFIFIPIYSLYGAAFVNLGTHILVFTVLYYFSRSFFRWKNVFVFDLLLAAACSFLMVFVLSLSELGLFASVISGVLLYFLPLATVKYFIWRKNQGSVL